MGNCWLHTNKVTSSITITPSSENLLYPKTNLYNWNPASVFRTQNSSTSHNIVFDFGSAVSIDTCAIANVNFTSSATIRIQGHTADSWGTPDVNELISVAGFGYDPAYVNIFHKLTTTYSKRYWRLLIDDITNPDGFYEVGEFWLGVRVTPSVGQDFEITWTQNFSDANIVHQTDYLHDYAYIRDVGDIRSFELEWTGVTSSTRDELRKLKRSVSTSGYPFWLVADNSANPIEAWFVRMIGDFQVTQRSKTAFNARTTCRELARGQTLPSD